MSPAPLKKPGVIMPNKPKQKASHATTRHLATTMPIS